MVFARLFFSQTRAAPMMKTKTVGQTSIARTAKAAVDQAVDYFEGLATRVIQKMGIAKLQRKGKEEGANMGMAKVSKSNHCWESIDDKTLCFASCYYCFAMAMPAGCTVPSIRVCFISIRTFNSSGSVERYQWRQTSGIQSFQELYIIALHSLQKHKAICNSDGFSEDQGNSCSRY
jgi:hypothetical protein